MARHYHRILFIALGLIVIHVLRAEGFVSLDSLPRVGEILEIDTLESSRVEGEIRSFLDSAGIQIHEGVEAQLLRGGQEKFDDLFAHIREAKDHIHLEYFNFRKDSISGALFDLLEERASKGVEVRILFDAFGNASNDRPLRQEDLDSIRSRGIKIVKFDPLDFPWINHVFHRDHRKIAIIDGRVGYIGGINVADYYIKGLPRFGAWRDLHMRLEGSVVLDLQRAFAGIWEGETGESLEEAIYFPKIEPSNDLKANADVAIVDRVPHSKPRAMRRLFCKLISSAKKHIRIINPYFVPVPSVYRALNEAIDRGVLVEIMASARADIPFTPEAAQYKLRRLARRGAKVYLYKEGFHHTKMITVDGVVSSIGSANLNSRSLRYDYETNAVLISKPLAEELEDLFDKDRAHSLTLDDEYWARRSVFKKVTGWFANLLTPFL